MGFLDKLKEKGRGVVTAAKPEDGVEPQPADEVRNRLLAISGKGIETGTEDDGQIAVVWSAKVASAGAGGAAYEYLYRALRIELDESEHEATGIGLKTSTEAELTSATSRPRSTSSAASRSAPRPST